MLREICEIVEGPISAEVVATEASAMLEGGRKTRAHPSEYRREVPADRRRPEGDARAFPRGVKVNVTLIFTPAVANAARPLSPFVGRLDDIGQDGVQIIEQMARILSHYDYPAQVLVVSVRNLAYLLRTAEIGAHVATVPFSVLRQVLHHPLTDKSLDAFGRLAQDESEDLAVDSREGSPIRDRFARHSFRPHASGANSTEIAAWEGGSAWHGSSKKQQKGTPNPVTTRCSKS